MSPTPSPRGHVTDSVQTMRTPRGDKAIPERRWTELCEGDGNMFCVAGGRVCSYNGAAVAAEHEESENQQEECNGGPAAGQWVSVYFVVYRLGCGVFKVGNNGIWNKYKGLK